MIMAFFIKGLILGFSIAAPVGPIGVLCIRRTLAHGRLAGFVSGLGAATADALYGCLAALGFTLATGGSHVPSRLLGVVGGLFLLYLGISTFRSIPTDAASGTPAASLLMTYLGSLMLTLTNPLTLLSFAAMVAGVGAGSNGGAAGTWLLVLGIFCGSALWWSILSAGVGLLRERLEAHARWINRGSGLIIMGFALAALLG